MVEYMKRFVKWFSHLFERCEGDYYCRKCGAGMWYNY